MAGALPPEEILHASCVALGGRALLIRGASGRGKSGLALSLMGLGAQLVGDDRIRLAAEDGALIARSAPNLDGLIEARGIGLLRAEPYGPARVVCVIDLDDVETERLPPLRKTCLLGISVDLLYRVESPHFGSSLLQYLKAGRLDPS